MACYNYCYFKMFSLLFLFKYSFIFSFIFLNIKTITWILISFYHFKASILTAVLVNVHL